MLNKSSDNEHPCFKVFHFTYKYICCIYIYIYFYISWKYNVHTEKCTWWVYILLIFQKQNNSYLAAPKYDITNPSWAPFLLSSKAYVPSWLYFYKYSPHSRGRGIRTHLLKRGVSKICRHLFKLPQCVPAFVRSLISLTKFFNFQCINFHIVH